MRTSDNPIKANPQLSGYKRHRIIMPVYIPNLSGYYREAFKIFTVSLNSLIETTKEEQINITIINNGSIQEVDAFVRQKLLEGKIDQYIYNSVNRGKGDAIVGAAKASYESFITFTDADVMFYPGWLKAVEQIFSCFERAGAVSPFPTPNLKFTFTSAVWFDKFFSVKKGKVVSDQDLKSFEESIGIEGFFKKEDLSHQYYIANAKVRALIGAGHFVCTYRREVFTSFEYEATQMGLKGGLKKIDENVDLCGFYRLSLPVPYVYHMGNIYPGDEYLSRSCKGAFKGNNGSPPDRLGKRAGKSNIPFFLRKNLFYGLLILHKIGLK